MEKCNRNQARFEFSSRRISKLTFLQTQTVVLLDYNSSCMPNVLSRTHNLGRLRPNTRAGQRNTQQDGTAAAVRFANVLEVLAVTNYFSVLSIDETATLATSCEHFKAKASKRLSATFVGYWTHQAHVLASAHVTRSTIRISFASFPDDAWLSNAVDYCGSTHLQYTLFEVSCSPSGRGRGRRSEFCSSY